MRTICELETREPGITSRIFEQIRGEIEAALTELVDSGIANNTMMASILLRAYLAFGTSQEGWEAFVNLQRIEDPSIVAYNQRLANIARHLLTQIIEFIPDTALTNTMFTPSQEMAVCAVEQVTRESPVGAFNRLVATSNNPGFALLLRDDKN